MPGSSPRSNVRAFVQWKEPSVYAGEELECIITFKNVALQPELEQDIGPPATQSTSFTRDARHPGLASQGARGTAPQSRAAVARTSSIPGVRNPSGGRGPPPILSLNIVAPSSKSGPQSAPLQARTPGSATFMKGHGRSLSIMSLGSEAPSGRRTPTTITAAKRPARGGHSRSSSAQTMPKSPPQSDHSTKAVPPRQQSPLYEATTPPAMAEGPGESLPVRPVRRRPGTVSAGNTPQLRQKSTPPHDTSNGQATLDLDFPARGTSRAELSSPQSSDVPKPSRSPSNMHSGLRRPHSPRPVDGWSGVLGNLDPISRVISEASAPGTPRSSAEFYSMSNNSDDTVISELPSQNEAPAGSFPQSRPSTGSSRKPSFALAAAPETLMMGYARTTGHFTLDGSLVNGAPFEEVKRKGVQGGGGVVGVERSKRSSGVFGALSWGNIGESLGGLLGSDEMGSMAQMKASAGAKQVPLLSTPQSLLFVNLTLAPGESTSYDYRFTLPKGLPPSHRGRAIKIDYHLSIGIQRPEGQAMKYVQVPFRVLGTVGSKGEMLVHDLMSPFVLLQDAARTKSIAPGPPDSGGFPPFPQDEPPQQLQTPHHGLEDFLRYTERLLDAPEDPNGALLSPTEPPSPLASRKPSFFAQTPASAKEAIDLAIMRSNQAAQPGTQASSKEAQSPNRFTITRSGRPVAVLTLLRPAYRLGESVVGTLDFTAPPPASSDGPAPVQAYSVLLELESAERVDASLALRAAASLHRVTRRVHASTRENTLFARRVGVALAVPAAATPSFETTGVSLLWSLRVEFTTARDQGGRGLGIEAGGEQGGGGVDELFDELGRDDRGVSLIAKERLAAEAFEIAVPLRIYGAPCPEFRDGRAEALEI